MLMPMPMPIPFPTKGKIVWNPWHVKRPLLSFPPYRAVCLISQ